MLIGAATVPNYFSPWHIEHIGAANQLFTMIEKQNQYLIFSATSCGELLDSKVYTYIVLLKIF